MTNGGKKEEPHIGPDAPETAQAKRATREDIKDVSWERELIERLAMFGLKEQRNRRRWGIFFKILLVVYIVILTLQAMPGFLGEEGFGGKHTALVEIRGVIADETEANADSIITGLRDAFKDSRTAGVIVRINSPGGSPVQAGYVYDEIVRLRKEYPDIPLYAVVTDICASGGYYIAAAADKIYANKASIVGSIGVLMDGFGFVGTLDKLGIERRLLTAGEHKGILDPFSPSRPEDVKFVQQMLDDIHQQFIDAVKRGRGNRLKNNKDIFSGLFWTGEQGVELGLVDAMGSSSYVAREVIGAEKIVDFTNRPPVFERLAERMGAATARTLETMGLHLR